MPSSGDRRSVWFGLSRLIGALILANALVAHGATILFEFANLRQVGFPGSVTFRSPIYGPEPLDPSQIISGQSSEGVPRGTAVYAGARLDGTGYTAELLFGESQDNLAPVSNSRTPFLPGSNAG